MLLVLAHHALLQAFAVSACCAHCAPNEYERSPPPVDNEQWSDDDRNNQRAQQKKSKRKPSPLRIPGRIRLEDEYNTTRWFHINQRNTSEVESQLTSSFDCDDDDTNETSLRINGKRHGPHEIDLNDNNATTTTTTSVCCGNPQCKRRRLNAMEEFVNNNSFPKPQPTPIAAPFLDHFPPPSPPNPAPSTTTGGGGSMHKRTTTKLTRVSYCPVSNIMVQESVVISNSCWYT